MKELWNVIQAAISAIGAWMGWFLGGCDGLVFALLIIMAADYVTGVMCAAADKKLSSKIGFTGIMKKCLILVMTGVGNILDIQLTESSGMLRTAIIFFYISNEGLSMLENAAYLGLPVPKKLKAVLEQLHDKSERGEDKK